MPSLRSSFLPALVVAGCSSPVPRPTEPVLAPIQAPVFSAIELLEPEPRVEAPAPEPEDPGAELGRYRLTYYWMARQPQAAKAPRRVALRDRHGKVIARVSRAFARKLRMEGTGILADGRIINIGGACRRTKRCYAVLDESTPFGIGVADRPLRPFRSVAAPPHVKVGTVLYIAELDGLTVPGAPPHGGYVHDGCVVADDRGGGVKGRQLDLFAARRASYDSFFRRHRIDRVTVHRGGERCADVSGEPATIAHRGQG